MAKADKITILEEIALFQSADHSIIIWTVENVASLIQDDFRTMVCYPKNDETGYITVMKARNKEQALVNHQKTIKKLVIGCQLGYK